MSQFADIIVPLPVQCTYTYAVPENMRDHIAVGMRVVVNFGKRKFYTGIVRALTNHTDNALQTKPIVALQDEHPMVYPEQLQLWERLAKYYHAPIGDVYRAALPAGLILESETMLTLNATQATATVLADNEYIVCSTLRQIGKSSIAKLNQVCGGDMLPSIRHLMQKGVITLAEDLRTNFKPRQAAFVLPCKSLHELLSPETQKLLTRAPKQQALLDCYLELAANAPKQAINRALLLQQAQASIAVYHGLEEKKLLRTEMQVVSRLEQNGEAKTQIILTETQKKVYLSIEKQWKHNTAVLLHGVTSSGKTEIYIKQIERCLQNGRQALFLVPEISLTTQLAERLRRVFGNRIGVYHSRFSDAERVEIWNNMLSQQHYDVILGTRSAVFLPYERLGLIVIDEEHDASYKQQDPSPRYHARTAAMMLAKQHDCQVLLGSATPSIESYCAAMQHRIGLTTLTQRYSQVALPNVSCIDMKAAYAARQVHGHFSHTLRQAVANTLQHDEQVILFQNRRGFAAYVDCNLCGWTPGCPHCAVSLTYHKQGNRLVCHYCGYTISLPERCPDCGNERLLKHGLGTELIEDETARLFPQARVARMDLDTTRSKQAFAHIVDDFEAHRTDILIGTQMVTKGLDFSNVALVGILNADNLLNFPDFRASERAFQLLLQVSGRAGRRDKRGQVLIQTMQPDHPVLRDVMHHDYAHFFATQMRERQLFRYPPFCRLIQVVMRHHVSIVLDHAANALAAALRQKFDKSVLGPDYPLVGRIRNRYIKHILVKIDITQPFEQAKQQIDDTIATIRQQPGFKSIDCYMNLEE